VLSELLLEGRLQLALLIGDLKDEDCIEENHVPVHWLKNTEFQLDAKEKVIPLVLFRTPCAFRQLATTMLSDSGKEWECVHEGEDLQTLRAAVKANIGITALPFIQKYPSFEIISENQILPHLPDMQVSLRRHHNWKSRKADDITEFVRNSWTTFRSG